MKKQYNKATYFLTFINLFCVIFSSTFISPSFQLSAIAQTQKNNQAEADRLRKQGEQQLAAGQYVLGTQTLERAMRIYQEIGDNKNADEIKKRLKRIYGLRGLPDKIEQLNPEQSEQNSQEEEKPKYEFQLSPKVKKLVSQGFSRQAKQDSLGAQKYFEQALSQAKNIGREQDKIAASAILGAFYLYEEDYVNALENLNSANRLSAARYQSRKPGSYYYLDEIYKNRIPILLLLGEAYLQNKNPNQALIYLEEAYSIAPRKDNWNNDIGVVSLRLMDFIDPSLYLSRTHYSLGNYNQALTYARKAIKRGKNIQNYYDISKERSVPHIFYEGDFGNGHGHILAGIALEKQGKLQQAEQELRQAIQIFETIRKKSRFQGFTRHYFKLFNNQVRATSILQRVLLAQNKPAEALAVAEWGRARLLLEAATVPSNITLEEKVNALVDIVYTPESICKRISRNHQNYLNSYQRTGGYIYNAKGERFLASDLLKDFDCDEVAKKEIQERKQTWLAIAKKNPAALDELATLASKAPSNIKPPNIEQLKQIASSQQKTIVEYSIISETTYFHPVILPSDYHNFHWNTFPGKEEKLVIWVIKPTGEIQSRQIDLKNKNINFKELVTNARRSMGLERSMGVFSEQGSTRNLSVNQTKNNLKKLHQLLIEPIAELLPNDPEGKVVFVPHKQLFLVPFALLIDSNDKYLIEKHTIITAPSIQALKVTREKQQKLPLNSKLAVVVGNPTMPSIPTSNNEATKPLSSLPGAESEGRQVAQKLNSQFLTGNKATKATVLKQLPNARYIHLATHGLLEDYAGFGIPGAIALAPSGKDNGFLTSSEIQELNLKAELAVLSACDTGRGDITGDGVIGLSRALIIAGVPSVVVSLWAVPDAPTAELMVEFYRNFQERKLDKAQALRQAMLTIMKKDNNRDNPVKWGAFTLVGQAG